MLVALLLAGKLRGARLLKTDVDVVLAIPALPFIPLLPPFIPLLPLDFPLLLLLLPIMPLFPPFLPLLSPIIPLLPLPQTDRLGLELGVKLGEEERLGEALGDNDWLGRELGTTLGLTERLGV